MWRSRGPNQVWASDITYVPLRHGFMYLVAVHRLVQPLRARRGACRTRSTAASAWRRWTKPLCARHGPRSSTPTKGASSRPRRSPSRLESRGVAISMDGRGRALDNVFIERLWRSVKYEDVYLQDYASVRECRGVAGGVLRVLQRRAASPVARLPHAGGSLRGRKLKPKPGPRRKIKSCSERIGKSNGTQKSELTNAAAQHLGRVLRAAPQLPTKPPYGWSSESGPLHLLPL